MIHLLREDQELFEIFSLKEEYNPIILDKHRRFNYYLSKNRNVFEPCVSKFLMEKGFFVNYPYGKKFAVCLTHDIDSIYPFISYSDIFINSLKKALYRQFRSAFHIAFHRINRSWNSLWNFEEILKLERKYNAKSSFYIPCLRKGEFDFNFNIEDLSSELAVIIDSGSEVGLHGGYNSCNDIENLNSEKERLEDVLGKEVLGYRNHYLRFTIPETWKILERAGFKYDSTLGYADCVGFRNGMCHPFLPYDLLENKLIGILEIPVAIMDKSLFGYMGLDMNMAERIVTLLIEYTAKYSGVLTILWHNSYMDSQMQEFYEHILKYCSEKGAWMTSGEEIYRWYSNYV